MPEGLAALLKDTYDQYDHDMDESLLLATSAVLMNVLMKCNATYTKGAKLLLYGPQW